MRDTVAAPAGAIGYGNMRAERVISWLKARESKILVAGVCLQVLVLAGMIALQSMPLLFGKTILLRVVPVDPRDFFRGDYVILSYEFNKPPGPWRGRGTAPNESKRTRDSTGSSRRSFGIPPQVQIMIHTDEELEA